MDLPEDVPVMTLPNAILFPQVMLPLFIFEPRYKRMLKDVLESSRTFAIAMQQPGASRGTPSSIAGLGLVRAAVTNKDGTSHLILQGLARIQLTQTVRTRPYRREHYRLLETTGQDSVVVDALSAKVLDLVTERFKLGLPFPLLSNMLKSEVPDSKIADLDITNQAAITKILEYLSKLENPDQLADLVSCTLLSGPQQRQTILETTNLEARLKHLIHFLLQELDNQRKSK